MNADLLFDLPQKPQRDALTDQERELQQYNTAAWFAELLYDKFFSHLTEKDLVWEPASGFGAALAAVPAHVPAIGNELDPARAQIAALRTGRVVTVGDFCTVPLPVGMTAMFGNPPFELALIERLLERSAPVMKEGDICGLVLPAYHFQTSSTVVRLNAKWTIAQDMIPRDLFNRPVQMVKPLVFARFIRDNQPHLINFIGYFETAESRELPAASQKLMDESFQGPRSVWREVFAKVLKELGGEASLSAVYRAIEGNRPTGTKWWKEQLRKVAQKHFKRVGEGIYALPAAA